MKKCLLLVAAVFLAATWTAAEAIDAVSFNPARLGRYENLKISGGLTSRGGISAQAVTVQSGGTVTFNNAGNYQADRTEVQGTLNMPNTDFNTTTLYSSGPASFVGSGTSRITNMVGSSMRVQANRMALRQVSVSGEATTDYDGNSISGFVLGNNTIPTAPSECQGLQWVSRVTDQGVYKVLGFASCGTEEPPAEEETCQPPNGETTTYSTTVCSCGGRAKGTWNSSTCQYDYNKNINVTIECGEIWYTGDDLYSLVRPECSISPTFSEIIEIDVKEGKMGSAVMLIPANQSTKLDITGCGWDNLGNDASWCVPMVYTFENTGTKEMTKTCGGCTYHFTIEELGQTDERDYSDR